MTEPTDKEFEEAVQEMEEDTSKLKEETEGVETEEKEPPMIMAKTKTGRKKEGKVEETLEEWSNSMKARKKKAATPKKGGGMGMEGLCHSHLCGHHCRWRGRVLPLQEKRLMGMEVAPKDTPKVATTPKQSAKPQPKKKKPISYK